jgi:hypothetical protein
MWRNVTINCDFVNLDSLLIPAPIVRFKLEICDRLVTDGSISLAIGIVASASRSSKAR